MCVENNSQISFGQLSVSMYRAHFKDSGLRKIMDLDQMLQTHLQENLLNGMLHSQVVFQDMQTNGLLMDMPMQETGVISDHTLVTKELE